MRTRPAIFLLALVGGIGAAALAVASHRAQLNLDLAQRMGGEEARAAVQSSIRFGQMQELGFLALALIFLALFLFLIALRNEREIEKSPAARSSVRIVKEAPFALAPAIPAPQPAPEPTVAPQIEPEQSVVSPREESAPHA